MTRILVTSASGANGDGYGALLGFSADGQLAGPFGDDRVVAIDQQGTVVLDSGRAEGLDPGGGTFAPDGRYCVTLRRRGTILALPPGLDSGGEPLLPDRVVPFPRGFGFGAGGELYLSSGIGPSGDGDNTITVFDHRRKLLTPQLMTDPELSPLDLAIAPSGNLVVSSEWPFGSADAQATIREYDPATGQLVRVLAPEPSAHFTKPALVPACRMLSVPRRVGRSVRAVNRMAVRSVPVLEE